MGEHGDLYPAGVPDAEYVEGLEEMLRWLAFLGGWHAAIEDLPDRNERTDVGKIHEAYRQWISVSTSPPSDDVPPAEHFRRGAHDG